MSFFKKHAKIHNILYFENTLIVHKCLHHPAQNPFLHSTIGMCFSCLVFARCNFVHLSPHFPQGGSTYNQALPFGAPPRPSAPAHAALPPGAAMHYAMPAPAYGSLPPGQGPSFSYGPAGYPCYPMAPFQFPAQAPDQTFSHPSSSSVGTSSSSTAGSCSGKSDMATSLELSIDLFDKPRRLRRRLQHLAEACSSSVNKEEAPAPHTQAEHQQASKATTCRVLAAKDGKRSPSHPTPSAAAGEVPSDAAVPVKKSASCGDSAPAVPVDAVPEDSKDASAALSTDALVGYVSRSKNICLVHQRISHTVINTAGPN